MRPLNLAFYLCFWQPSLPSVYLNKPSYLEDVAGHANLTLKTVGALVYLHEAAGEPHIY
jgi:hypothetical protein